MAQARDNARLTRQLCDLGRASITTIDAYCLRALRPHAAAFGLPAPSGRVAETVRAMLRASGLGMYVKYLQSAHAYAESRGEKPTWDTFASVYDAMADLANP